MTTIHFQLVTPEKTVQSEELVSLTCPTQMGEITILPQHEALVAGLAPGEVKTKDTTGKEAFFYVSGGFVEVKPGSKVVMLADAAEHHYEIDLAAAEEAKKRAEKAMHEQALSSEEYARVAASLQQSLARINVARKHAHRQGPMSGEGVLSE